MFFAQKIYYNNKPLILTNDRLAYIQNHPIAKGYLAFSGPFRRNFRLAFEHLGKITALGAIIEDVSKTALLNELHGLYQPIDAAGGVVMNEEGAVLMIFRRGKWDLPKGKCDDGEEIDTCAIREVSEETGLHQLAIEEKICDTYHVYSQGRESLLKKTAWYRMKGTKDEKLVPQLEENILMATWISEKELPSVVLKTYDAIKEVLHEAGYSWQ